MDAIIELHDSRVADIVTRDGTVTVHFATAYLHKSEGRPGCDAGTGWTQPARLVFEDGSLSGSFPLPCDVADGELILDGERYDNHIPVPLASGAFAELRLVFTSIDTAIVRGRGVRLELVDEPEYVEEFEP